MRLYYLVKFFMFMKIIIASAMFVVVLNNLIYGRFCSFDG